MDTDECRTWQPSRCPPLEKGEDHIKLEHRKKSINVAKHNVVMGEGRLGVGHAGTKSGLFWVIDVRLGVIAT